MKLEDFLNKKVVIELKDGTHLEGIIIDIKDIDNEVDSIFYTTINLRLDYNDYRILYINEIDTIGEIE